MASMSSSTGASNDIKCLEHQTLKVPYEVLNKKFRMAQKNIDREVQKVQAVVKELEKCIQSTPEVDVHIAQVLNGVAEKLMMMKRKAEETIHDEIEAAKACKRRLDHLKETENSNPFVINLWKKKRLDRMLVEYFLRNGFYETALKLAKYSGIEDLTNIELFMVSKEVEAALLLEDTSKCLNYCYDNKSKLRKMKSSLEFSLHQQEFVELVRANKRMDAIRHARKHFASLEDPQYNEIQKCMGLLAFPIDTQIYPYKELFDNNRWQYLIDLFRKENYKLFQLNSEAVFTVTLQAGLSALKTPQCYLEESCKDKQKVASCPICSEHMNVLARKLPFAHCAQSRLICAMSGQALNEHNPPTMLPNGYVYGYNSLSEMATINNGMITCPRTQQTFNFKDVEKVYVM